MESSVLDAIGWDEFASEPDAASPTDDRKHVNEETTLRQRALESIYANYRQRWTYPTKVEGPPSISPDGSCTCLFEGPRVHLVSTEDISGTVMVSMGAYPVRSCHWLGAGTLLVHVSGAGSWGLHLLQLDQTSTWVSCPLWSTQDRPARDVGHAVVHASGNTVAIGWPGLSSGGLRNNGSLQLYSLELRTHAGTVMHLERELFGWRDDDRLGSVLWTCGDAVAAASALDGHCKIDVLYRFGDCWELLGSIPTAWKEGSDGSATLSLHVRTTGANIYLTVGEASPSCGSRVSVYQRAVPRGNAPSMVPWRPVGEPLQCGGYSVNHFAGSGVYLCEDARTLFTAWDAVHIWKLFANEWCRWSSIHLDGPTDPLRCTHVHSSDDGGVVISADALGTISCHVRQQRAPKYAPSAPVRPEARGRIELVVHHAVRLPQRSPYLPLMHARADLTQAFERAGVFAVPRAQGEWALGSRAVLDVAPIRATLDALCARFAACGIEPPPAALFREQITHAIDGILAIGGRVRPLRGQRGTVCGAVRLRRGDCVALEIFVHAARTAALLCRQRIQWVQG